MSHEVSFTGQITPDQVPMIAENGFKTIINKCLSPVASSIKTMLKNLLTFLTKLSSLYWFFAVPVTAQRVSMKQQSVWIC